VHIGCDDNAHPTGNLQASINDARVTAPEEDDISVGQQTVPFKNVGEIITPGINIVKTGPDLSKVGDQVTYNYVVTNNGNVALDNVEVIDDAGTPGDNSDDFSPTFTGGDDSNDGLLDTDETWTYSKLFTIPQGASDPFTNTVTVTANASGNEQETTDDQDTHTIELFQPSIDLEKDADVSSAAVGDQIVYSYTVTSDGSSDSPGLSIVSLIDDNGTPGDTGDDFTPDTVDLDTDTFNDGDANTNGLIDVGETWLFTATRTVLDTDPDPLVNTAVVHANPDGFPNDITDTDTAGVDLFQPAIKVVKDGNATSKVGDKVTYTYAVTNESSQGSPALENVALTDDAGTPNDGGDDFVPAPVDDNTDTFNDGDTNTDGKLDIGETWLYTADFIVPVGASDPLVNTVTVTADVVGSVSTATDTDTHSVDLFQPSIQVTKDGPASVPAGGSINYTYTLQNTGSSDSPGLSIVSLIDDSGTPGNTGDDFTPDTVDLNTDTFNDGDTNTNGLLDVGETWLYTGSVTAPSIGTSITNTVVVHANPEGFPNDITDSDDHTVIVEAPPPEAHGRMTGGGSVFLTADMIGGPVGTRVTHGFQVHCSRDPKTGLFETVNNRLEINWSPGKANVHFHLSYLTDVQCEDDPALDPEHPLAPIDTFRGVGVGTFTGKFNGIRYNKALATIVFVFTDDGERGINDTASYKIMVGNVVVLQTEADPTLDTDDPGDLPLRFGNHQAHKEIPPLLAGDSTLKSLQKQMDSTLNSLNKEKLTQSKITSLTSKLASLTDRYNDRVDLLTPPPVFQSAVAISLPGTSTEKDLDALLA
jgi:hypothetical protein